MEAGFIRIVEKANKLASCNLGSGNNVKLEKLVVAVQTSHFLLGLDS